jgi:signal transduction histidine kinase
MRSMFVKLFLWFWLATILSGIVFFLLAINLRMAPMHDERRRHFDAERNSILSQALTLYGQTAAAALERQGASTPFAEAESSAPGGMKAYLFAANGTELSHGVPPQIRDAVRTRVAPGAALPVASPPASPPAAYPGARPEAHPRETQDHNVVVVEVRGPSGKPYLAALQAKPGLPPREPLRHFPFPPDFWLQMLITFVVSGGVCYLLSWRITAPVRRLRAAAQELAGGNLATRVAAGREGTGDELSDLGRDFNKMAVRLEKLVTAHQQLVRDVSHELRSPLARMNVALGIARKQSPPTAEPALDRIELEGERLNQLIGELLTLSQLEGGAAGEKVEFDLVQLAEEVARDADFEACASDRRVQFDPAPGLGNAETGSHGLELKGNRELLRRALENVVRNAVRYTAQGSSVLVALELEAGSQAVLRVRDFGPGVPQEQLADIFRPFYRVAQARDRQSGGTGIGLAITEKTVQLHGGTVSARNLPDAGLEVEIRLPLPPHH